MSYMLNKIKRKHNHKKYKKELAKYRCVDIYKYHFQVTTINNDVYDIGAVYKYTILCFDQYIKELLKDKTIKTNDEILICTSNIVDIKLINTEEVKEFYHYKYGDSRDAYVWYFSEEYIEEQTTEYKKLKASLDIDNN